MRFISILSSLIIYSFCNAEEVEVNKKQTSQGDSDRSSKSSESSNSIFMKPTIVGGHDAEKDRFKYIVSLTTNSGRHVCGGSLIASDIVLTAAHCEGYFSKAVVGLYHNTDDHLQETESFNVTGTIVHPFYDQKFLRYDFLVVKLDNHSSYPIVSLDVDHKLTTTSILVLGWGITDSDNRTPYVGPLQVAFLKYIPNDM